MKEHEFWRDRSTGRVYAVEFEDGLVIGLCGPLDVSEIEEEFLETFDYSQERAAWLEQHREEFELFRPTVPYLKVRRDSKRLSLRPREPAGPGGKRLDEDAEEGDGLE